MDSQARSQWIANPSDLILVTGANGFIGKHLVQMLLEYGFNRIRCLVRSNRGMGELESVAAKHSVKLEILNGNLLSAQDCARACEGVVLIYHLAVGATGKSFAGSVMNVVVPTRNLLDAAVKQRSLARFVNVSSFAVYSNRNKPVGRTLDESCPIDERPQDRGDAYAYAKLKQDQLVADYAKQHGMSYVTLRPGIVYGPGKAGISGRVGVSTFGFFVHLGGGNSIPLTYVSNCAEAIVRAGLVPGVSGEVINVVDDDLPTSRRFLSLYKKHVKRFRSLYLPHALSYAFCWLWEAYVKRSHGQLPMVFSRGEWHAYWKSTRYSNHKLKRLLGWEMRTPTEEGLKNYFDYCRQAGAHD